MVSDVAVTDFHNDRVDQQHRVDVVQRPARRSLQRQAESGEAVGIGEYSAGVSHSVAVSPISENPATLVYRGIPYF
jgi:hypothetical protein